MGAEQFEAEADRDGVRLDVFLSEQVEDLDRNRAGEMIRAGKVQVVGRSPIKPSMWLTRGDRVCASLPPPKKAEAEAQAIELPILYADRYLVVVVKPAGMATHPGPGWWGGSAVNALLHHIRDWQPISGIATPGIVHRLDRDTSGLLIFANGSRSHQALLAAMRERRIRRKYLALAHGSLTGAGTIDAAIARDPENAQRMRLDPEGQSAITHWRALRNASHTLLELALETGRNHQIRIHLASQGHPVVGDRWYGVDDGESGLRLHAYSLEFQHPMTEKLLHFVSPPPWLGPRVTD